MTEQYSKVFPNIVSRWAVKQVREWEGSKARRSDLVPLSVVDDAWHADGGVAAAQIVAQVSHALLQLDGGEVSVVYSGHVEHQPRGCFCAYLELDDQPEEQTHAHEEDEEEEEDEDNWHSPVLHHSVVKLKGHVTVSGQTELLASSSTTGSASAAHDTCVIGQSRCQSNAAYYRIH